MPLLGGWSPATATAIATSPRSIRMHPDQAELKAMMKRGGFGHVDVHNLSGRRRGAACRHQVLKPTAVGAK